MPTLGYDVPRPTRDDYDRFKEFLVRGLQDLDIEGLGLMAYGSSVRPDFTPGRSDIDTVLTFPADVVIDKEDMRSVSRVIHIALTPAYVPFQVCPIDTTTMRTAKLNVLTDDFGIYFETEGSILLGPDYRNEMRYAKLKSGEESAISHNLRKARIALLFAEYHQSEDPGKFVSDFESILNTVSRGSKQVIGLADNVFRKNRFAALEGIRSIFPGVDPEPLERIKGLFTEPRRLDPLFHKPEEMRIIAEESLTFLEEVIRAYIHDYHQSDS
jgi:hypothetical protein